MLANNYFAKRIEPQVLPPPQTVLQKQGLAYERRVVRALKNKGLEVEHNPWFEYSNGICCPDILVYEFYRNYALVVEVKLTAMPAALAKLTDLYCPVVKAATGLHVLPLLIAKNITKATTGTWSKLFFNSDILSAVSSPSPIYLWPGRGPIT